MDMLLTVQEVAERLRVKASWVYSHHSELGGYRLGKYLRFSWPRVLQCLGSGAGSLGPSPTGALRDLDFNAPKIDREQTANKNVD
jgi:hypothetical protein